MRIKRTMVIMAVMFSTLLAVVSFGGGEDGIYAESIVDESPVDYCTVTFYSGDTVLDTMVVLSGHKVVPPTVDYPVLSHWCIGSIDGEEFDPESPITSNLDLYAKYVDCSIGELTTTVTGPKTIIIGFQSNNVELCTISWGDGTTNSIISSSNQPYNVIHTYSTIPHYVTIDATNETSSDQVSLRIAYDVTMHNIDETVTTSTVFNGSTASAPSSQYRLEWHKDGLDGELFDLKTPVTGDLDLYAKSVDPVFNYELSQNGTISTTVSCSICIYYATSYSIDWGDGTEPDSFNISYLDGIYGDSHGIGHEYENGGQYQITIVAYAPLNSLTKTTSFELISTPDQWLQDDGIYHFDQSVSGKIVLNEDATIDMGGFTLWASIDVGEESKLVLKDAIFGSVYAHIQVDAKQIILDKCSTPSDLYVTLNCETLEIYGKDDSTVCFTHNAGDTRDVTIHPGSTGAVSIPESGKSNFTTTLTEGSSITIIDDQITIHGEASMGSALEERTINVDGKLTFTDRDDIQTGVVVMNGSKITMKDIRPGYVGMELKAGSVHMTGTFTSEDGGSIILNGQSYVDGSVVLDGVTATVMSGSTFTVSKDSTIEGINGGTIDNNGTVQVYGSLKASVDNSDGVTNFYEGSVGSNKVVGGTVNGVDQPMPVPDDDTPNTDGKGDSGSIDAKTFVILLVVSGIVGFLIARRFL